MSEDQGTYNTQGENAAEIHPPKTIQAIRDNGLVEYKVWGWVKISAKFISHIKRLRGAKLSIWQVLACSIDENGKCSLTIKELCELTGYSHTEILDSLKELNEMGYLAIDKSGKKNLYTPEFAARGAESPSETLVKKLESTPVYQVESTPSLEKSVPSIKELKELIPETSFDEGLADIAWTLKAGKKVTKKQLYKRAEASAFEDGIEVELKRLRLNWIAFDEKAKEIFRRFIRDLPAGQTLSQFVTWWLQDEWRAANPPWTLAVIMQRWLQAFAKQTDEQRPAYKTDENGIPESY
jgi:DNA-binding transcriptional regulator GbsR (MarR family)